MYAFFIIITSFLTYFFLPQNVKTETEESDGDDQGAKKWSAKNAFLFALFSHATLHMCKLMAFVLLEQKNNRPVNNPVFN
jgi:hypothetical protein